MSKLIRADLRRVLKKRSFYILIIIAFFVFLTWGSAETASDQVEEMKHFLGNTIFLAIAIPVFLGVYADDMKSGSLVGVVGSGISRRKVIVAKLIEAGILFLVFYAFAYVIALFNNSMADVGVTPRQNLYLLIYCIYCVIRGIGIFALAALIVFASWSAVGGMILLLLAATLLPMILQMIQSRVVLPVYDASLQGLLESSYAMFFAGRFGWQILPAVLIYLFGIPALSIHLFNKKEIAL
ncbi:MAG: hypothetical protein IJ239_07695 [Eubacterium sp.]|nr:hypothetical protein [Eubacterium sp.]